MTLPWSIYNTISIYCQGRMSPSLNYVEKKNEMCPIFVIFDDKIHSSDYRKKAPSEDDVHGDCANINFLQQVTRGWLHNRKVVA